MLNLSQGGDRPDSGDAERGDGMSCADWQEAQVAAVTPPGGEP